MNTVEAVILDLVQARGADKSICPTEAAREFSDQMQAAAGASGDGASGDGASGDGPSGDGSSGYGGDEAWRAQLKVVRAAAIRLAGEGKLVILRKGKPVDDLTTLRGVIRLRMK